MIIEFLEEQQKKIRGEQKVVTTNCKLFSKKEYCELKRKQHTKLEYLNELLKELYNVKK